MQRLLLTLTIAAAMAGASAAEESDLDRLQGTWAMHSVTLNGRETILEEKDRKSLEFNGASAVLDNRLTVEVTLKSDADPKTMDFLREVNGEKRTMLSFSYVLDGDTLLMTMEQGNTNGTSKYVRANKPPREWTDASGKHMIIAAIEEIDKAEVVLKRADGSLTRLPLEQLSQADQPHVRDLQASDKSRGEAIAYFQKLGASYSPGTCRI